MKMIPYTDQVPLDQLIWQCTQCGYRVVRYVDIAGRYRLHDEKVDL